ncbi:cysteine--tRNA ligase [Candidatus Nitrosocosmicus agrestis]|jgi:cysteinyl-tRNA synthetase|uniref:cysteine--tRNA ligase n=1 Tax=Candidatus Nitrosocosmicus agrestis TaxID=2563600 RepID=UPI00122E1D2A|nr:cysteine--tRNA ligase [Candidatus Nitrosocosmicus sp. SS]KAA2279283.1 cysteine--tRNA ligase [Candidatus Nitrosocosmicus sp. SS]KAF0867867.1 cysteine--tRNA ligase [Candidatus Nitrosocosmicus sp. SS]
MKLFNTLSKKIEEVDFNSGNINVYLCGVTVYDECHIGHARTIIVFDVLRRFLESLEVNVNFVQNFTDIDDKIITKASKENVTADEISKKYIDNYYRDFDELNVLRATHYPLVTENIDEIIDFVNNLIKKNMAYVGLNGVYYRVKSFPEYGKLSKMNIERMGLGARVEVDDSKDDPRDFALWKFSSKSPTWKAPWGSGRPGWHIECSVMALKYLGGNIDIHGGGQDLIFPHHENEIAQSEGLTGTEFAKLWMHVGMVTMQSEKMSKSIGNTVKVAEILKTVGPNVVRLFCLSSHYSKPIDYTDNTISEMKSKWRQVDNAYSELEFRIRNKLFSEVANRTRESILNGNKEIFAEFKAHLENDLNFSGATSSFFRFVNIINNLLSHEEKLDENVLKNSFKVLRDFIQVLGFKPQEVNEEEAKQIESLTKQRDRLRREKKYKEADVVRSELEEQFNVELIDHRNFTSWKKKTIDDI